MFAVIALAVSIQQPGGFAPAPGSKKQPAAKAEVLDVSIAKLRAQLADLERQYDRLTDADRAKQATAVGAAERVNEITRIKVELTQAVERIRIRAVQLDKELYQLGAIQPDVFPELTRETTAGLFVGSVYRISATGTVSGVRNDDLTVSLSLRSTSYIGGSSDQPAVFAAADLPRIVPNAPLTVSGIFEVTDIRQAGGLGRLPVFASVDRVKPAKR